VLAADIQTGDLHIKAGINTASVTLPTVMIITTTNIIIINDDYED
jgi:hypothetical protein